MDFFTQRVKIFVKKEAVLCIALVLAGISALFVPPDMAYIEYIDFRTLAILFCLMSVMAGLKKAGVFAWVAQGLLKKVRSSRSLIIILMLLCFFFSMLITNDVALITFVPFTFIVLALLGEQQKRRLVLPVVAMQTVAANLGSMMTPIGNPQNLYLYGKAGISICSFLALMFPYTVFSLVLLVAWAFWQGGKDTLYINEVSLGAQAESQIKPKAVLLSILIYLSLFVICLLSVGHILPWQMVFAIVLVVVFMMDRQVLTQVDYALLFTFIGFFIFIGNVGRIPVFRDFLQEMLTSKEVYTSVIASQVISNVPAALLLSGFTENYTGLIVGTNLGGLGTLIASMASLISYKYIAKEEEGRKGEYLKLFTVSNLCFLAALMLLHIILYYCAAVFT